MPSVTIPSSLTTTAPNDPFRFNLVSGFYGPGAWFSWLIALISSWLNITIFRSSSVSSSKSNYDMLAHVLYTNWAALDILRQIKNSTDLSFGPLAAAVLVAYWGLIHCILQFAYLGNMTNLDRRIVKLMGITGVGAILPSISLLTLVLSTYLRPHRLCVGVLYEILASVEDGDAVLATMSMFMCVSALGIPLALASSVYSALYDPDLKGANSVVFHGLLFVNTALELFVLLGYVGVPWAFWSAGVSRKECFFFKPCSEQSLGDWDQAFALFCALVMGTVEVGPAIRRISERR